MKKKSLIAFLLVFLFISLCLACSTQTSNWIIIYFPGVTEIGDTVNGNSDYDVTLLSSQEDLSDFHAQERMIDIKPEFHTKLDSYDSRRFFLNSYLIVIFVEFRSTASTPSFEKTSFSEGTLSINILESIDGPGGEIMAPWVILVEYPKNDVVTNVVVNFSE